MPTVSIPPEFFRSELRLYRDWREAMVRELLQNSVDAGAEHISLEVESVGGRCQVVITDDGQGMDRHTLEEVFFALGRTTKTGPDTVGGFGRARVITCFAQERYEIRTGHLHVTGSGGDYHLGETVDVVPGCQFRITLIDNNLEETLQAVRSTIARSTVGARVTLNGESLRVTTLPSRAVRILRDCDGKSWAKVYLLQDRVGELRVHVGGVPMFSRYLPGWDDVLVEIPTARGREVLAANRDQLAAGFSESLDRFVDNLTRNRRQALRDPATAIEECLTGDGFRLTEATNKTGVPLEAGSGEQGSRRETRIASSDAALAGGHGCTDATSGDESVVNGGGELLPTEAKPLGRANFYLSVPNPGKGTAALLRQWDPRRWDDNSAGGRRRLLAAWEEASAIAVEGLLEVHPELGAVPWATGWVLDSEIRAAHRRVETGHVLFLNPVRGRRWSLGQHQDRRDILARALHEAAHIVCDGHDEEYAGILTELYAVVDPRQADQRLTVAIKRHRAVGGVFSSKRG
jgi:hypothetical protein